MILVAPLSMAAEEASSTPAAEEEKKTYSLVQITERVRESSELVQAQKLKIESTEAQGRQATAWQNPSVSAELGRLRDPNNNAMTYDFRLTQPIYFPGKMGKQMEVYEREKEIQEMQAADLTTSLALEASYYAYAYKVAELKSRSINNRINRMSLMRTYMRAQAYASPAKIIQRNIVANQLLALQKTLNTAMAETESSWQKLNIYLNEQDKVVVAAPWLTELKEVDIVTFINHVREGNRRLKSGKLLLSRIEAEVSFQKRVPLPDVSVSAFYRREALEHPGANQFYGGAVTVPIPVLNANRSGVEAAEKRLEAARAETNYAQREVLQMARAVHAEYTQKRKLLNDFNAEQIPLLEKQMLYADRELKLGRIDLLSYLELELQTYQAIQSFYDTQLELVKAITQMIYLMGDSAKYKGDLYVFQAN
ncbi:MAG TPA: TolC family protein, partial [Turneriella sp.]|nr:TolC family protein [Turneriella sp.]